ncbi:hypothetical protein JRQ81_011950 [Phrynocephalus forsythii]|uniref:Uncharacterized protein n=1 Tax=Phrynocephalus forsythii TaxID=171643 RepID=A0A9Q1AQL1_9SAUR|nr:hypothetical protein JRQ81_011950 [Phrynocephalus forsythii]
MPSEELSLPAEDKVDGVAVAAGPVKASVHSSKGGHTGESRKMAKGSGQAATESGHLASEGEKDSGFSDVSSEYLSTMEQTDSEDQPPSDSLHRLPKWPTRAPPPKAPGGLVAGGAFPGLTPVYIVKNVILKQVAFAAPGGLGLLSARGRSRDPFSSLPLSPPL